MGDSELLQHINVTVDHKLNDNSSENIITHVTNHKNWNPFQCGFCSVLSRYFFNKYSLAEHQKSTRCDGMEKEKAAVADIEENDQILYDIEFDMEENPAVKNFVTL